METFNDAVEVIETATTLGMHVSAPLGVTAYTANIYMQDDSGTYTAEMGTYGTKEGALIALRNWVVQEWLNIGGPWEEYHEMKHLLPNLSEEEFYDWLADSPDASASLHIKLWLDNTTPEQVVDHYFNGYTDDRYDIIEIRIAPAPDLLQP